MKQTFTLFIIFLMSIYNVHAQSVIDSGLVACYPFNGNTNDEKNSLFNGINSGAVLTADRFGNENSAYYFDGINDFIMIGYDLRLEPDSFTITLWVKLQSSSNATSTIISSDPNSILCNHGYTFGYYNSGKILFDVDPSPACFDASTVNSEENLCDSNWHFLAAKYNGKVSLSIDGGQPIVSSSSSYSKTMGNIYIGKSLNDGSLNQHVKGVIDDIQIYNRALDDTEIAYLYNCSGIKKNTVDTLVSICEGFNHSDSLYTTSTEIIDTLKTISGCDSIVTYNLTIVDESCTSASIKNKEELSDINIYPNPTSNFLQIESDNTIEYIEVFSIYGSLIKNELFKSKEGVLNLEPLSNGLYIVMLTMENSFKVQRIIVKNNDCKQ